MLPPDESTPLSNTLPPVSSPIDPVTWIAMSPGGQE